MIDAYNIYSVEEDKTFGVYLCGLLKFLMCGCYASLFVFSGLGLGKHMNGDRPMLPT